MVTQHIVHILADAQSVAEILDYIGDFTMRVTVDIDALPGLDFRCLQKGGKKSLRFIRRYFPYLSLERAFLAPSVTVPVAFAVCVSAAWQGIGRFLTLRECAVSTLSK